jgi:dienelactone hydrolase
MLFGNILISVTYSNEILATIGYNFIVYLGFFGILGIGLLISYLDIKYLKNIDLWKESSEQTTYNKPSLKSRIIKAILVVFGLLTFGLSAYVAYVLVFSSVDDYIGWWIGIIFFPFTTFLSFILLSTTIIFLIILNRHKRPYLFYGVLVFGLILSSVFLFPLLSTPYTSFQAEKNFSQAFGENWRSKINPSIGMYFQTTPFTITELFLGNHPKDCFIDKDITFYSNSTEGISLAFDAYYPKPSGSSLPGNNSVIINIHGGAWTIGDKGPSNMLQVNKYFAAQGYVVFDIQYGLKEGKFSIIPTPEGVGGNFTIDDQLRQIGNFTKQLNTTKFSKYNLNLNSVFITGNSAGGHLSLATALLINSGNYAYLFGSHLKIKGIIPVYPADPPESIIKGREKFRNPENYFIDSNSPPCLLFQGTIYICVFETKHIKNQYTNAGNNNCCIILFPFQGHGNDLYYSGHFNQYKLYYIERFLYLCTQNNIE